MAIDDLIHNLNLRDDRYHLLLEMLISIESTNGSIIEFLMHETTGGDEELAKAFYDDFQKSQSRQRELIIQSLYERFGGLPDGLLTGTHK